MPGVSGKNGTLKFGQEQAEVLRWTLDVEAEVSKYGSGGWKRAVAGVINVSGSCEIVSTPPAVGSTVALELKEGTSGPTFSGSAVIRRVSRTVVPDTGEVIKYTVDFEGDGQWDVE